MACAASLAPPHRAACMACAASLAPPHGAAGSTNTIAIHKHYEAPPAGSIARRLLPWSDKIDIRVMYGIEHATPEK